MERVGTSQNKHTWPVVRLGDVCEFVYGFPFNSNCFNDDGVGKPLIRIRDVVPGNTNTFTTEGAPSKYNVADGDLLVGMDGDFNLAQWTGGPALLNQRVCMFKPKPDALSVGFLKHCLDKYLKAIWDKKPFATVKHLSAKDLNAIFLPLPSLSLQQEIVERLEKELAEVDSLAANFKRIAELADTEFKAELDETFMRADGERVRLGDVGTIVTGTTPSKAHKEFYGGDFPFFKPSDLNQGYDTLNAGDSLTNSGWQQARQLPKDSVLVTCIGATLGKTGIIRTAGACNQQINAVLPQKTSPEFLFYQIISPDFQWRLWNEADATTLPLVSKKEFSNLFVTVPPREKQSTIVAHLDSVKTRCECLKVAAEKGLHAAENLRAAILTEAFAQWTNTRHA